MSNDLENKNNFWQELGSLTQDYQNLIDEYNQSSEEFWQNLTEEQRLHAFYSVCKRIHQGDMVEQRSYRGVLYSTFGFGPEAYAIGMECGYLDIHNAIYASSVPEENTESNPEQ